VTSILHTLQHDVPVLIVLLCVRLKLVPTNEDSIIISPRRHF